MLPASPCTLQRPGHFKFSKRMLTPTKATAAKVCVLKLGPFLTTTLLAEMPL